MRRIFAFITLMISLLIVVIVGVPTINNSMNKGADFEGGYNILYHVTNSDGVEYKGDTRKSVMNTAASNANDKLNTLNITNPEVAIANDSYLSITIQDLPEEQLDVVRFALANNSKVTLRDTNDNWLADGDDVFEKLTLNSSAEAVSISCLVKDAAKLEEATTEVASNYTTDDSGNGEVNLVIWIGFQETYNDEMQEELKFTGDHYSDVSSNSYARFKILTAVAISSALTDSFSCTANVLDENVALMNELLDQDAVHYVMAETSTNKVGSFYKSNIPTVSIILGIIGIVLICALFVIIYKFSGIASALSIVVYSVLTLLLYNTFGGLFGLETIIALLVGVVLSVDANVVFLERIKDEIRKGKDIGRSFDEGAKKSTSAVLDANVLVLIAAFALYLFGTQVIKSFAAVLIISEVIIIAVVVFVTRFMIGLLAHAKIEKTPYKWFGVKDEEIGDLNDYESNKSIKESMFKKINFSKLPKAKFALTGLISVAGVVIGLLFALLGGSFFNTPENLRDGSRFYFTTYDSQFASEESVKEWFKNETSGRKPNKVIVSVDTETHTMNEIIQIKEKVETINSDIDENFEVNYSASSAKVISVYTVAVYYNKTLGSDIVDPINEMFEKEAKVFYDEDENINILDMNYSSGSYVAYSGTKALLRGLLVLGVVCLFMFAYLSIRFSISYALSAIVTILLGEITLFALLALLRVSIGVEAIAVGLGLAILSMNTNSITFDRLRESISETNDVVWTKQSRLEIVNKAIQDTAYGHFVSSAAALLLAILLSCVSFLGVLSGIALVLAIVAYTASSLFLMPHIWAVLDTVFAKMMAKSKERKARKVKPEEDKNEVSEYIFYGIND